MTAKTTKGRIEPTAPTVAQLLDTADPAEQAARIQHLLNRAAPRYAMLIQSGPSGVSVVPTGDAMTPDVIYAMLDQAAAAVRQEERRQLQAQLAAAAPPPSIEASDL